MDAYLATLERLRPLVAQPQHVVPGHGPLLDGARALRCSRRTPPTCTRCAEHGAEAELPRVGARAAARAARAERGGRERRAIHVRERRLI